jgi:hypothetical protein
MSQEKWGLSLLELGFFEPLSGSFMPDATWPSSRDLGLDVASVYVVIPTEGRRCPDEGSLFDFNRTVKLVVRCDFCCSSSRPNLWHDVARHDDPDRRPVSFRHQ